MMMPTEDALSKAPTRNGSAATGLDALPSTSVCPDTLSERLESLQPAGAAMKEEFLDNRLARVLQLRMQMSRCAPMPSLGGKLPMVSPQFVSFPQRRLVTPPPTGSGSPILFAAPLANMDSLGLPETQ